MTRSKTESRWRGTRNALVFLICAVLGVTAATAEGQEHVVVVANNFFAPADIVIAVGDSVRWNNGFGTHNVFSCTAEQSGCEGETANESFSSGPGATGPWTFKHTFTEAGRNRYLCQPHFSFMWGSVTVVDTPPAVPDGTTGQPMTVDSAVSASSDLILAWDSGSCSLAADHLVVYGQGSGLPESLDQAYQIEGSVCELGGAPPYTWQNSPTPAQGDILWWLVLATDGATVEGSWGHNTDGERAGPGVDGVSESCGVTAKDTRNSCGL